MLPDDIDVAVEMKRIEKQEIDNMNKFLENTKQDSDKLNNKEVENESVQDMGQLRRTNLQENKTD